MAFPPSDRSPTLISVSVGRIEFWFDFFQVCRSNGEEGKSKTGRYPELESFSLRLNFLENYRLRSKKKTKTPDSGKEGTYCEGKRKNAQR